MRASARLRRDARRARWRSCVTEAATNLVKHARRRRRSLLRALGARRRARRRGARDRPRARACANVARERCATAYSTAGHARHRPRRDRAGSRTSSTSTRGREQRHASLRMRDLGGDAAPATARRSRSARSACPSRARRSAATPGRVRCDADGATLRGRRRPRPRPATPRRPRARRSSVLRAQRAPSARSSLLERAHARAAPDARRGGGGRCAATPATRRARASRASATSRAAIVHGGDARAAWSRTTASSATTCARSQEFSYPWPAGALLVLHSDGLEHALGPRRYPGPARRAIPRSSRRALPRPRARARRRHRGRRCAARRGRDERSACSPSRSTPDADVVGARQRARQLAELLGFDAQDQTRIATAVSEIARNAFHYAGGGKVEFVLEGETAPQLLRRPRRATRARASPTSTTSSTAATARRPAWASGLVGARRLMDRFDDRARRRARAPTVTLGKLLPRRRAAGHAASAPASSSATLAALPQPDAAGRGAAAEPRAAARAGRAAATSRTSCSQLNARARGHQPRRGGAVRRARREGRVTCAAPTR